MAYVSKTWKGRQGVGLNKFSINGATPVPIINQPDSVTQAGDALSAGNLNDLEQRISNAFDDVDTALATKADQTDVTNLNNAISQHEARIENLEEKAGDYVEVQYRGTNAVPAGKAKNALVESIVGKTRAWNQLVKNGNFADNSEWTTSNATLSMSGNVATFRASATNGQIRNGTAMPLNNTHAYLFSLKVKGSSSFNQFNAIVSGAGAGTIAFNSISVTTSWQTLVGIFIPQNTNNGNIEIYDARTSGWDDIFISDVIFRDLGLILPEYTASYIKDTLGVSGVVSQLSSDILTYDSYGYSLVSTVVSGVKSIGVNIWDEEWEEGALISDGSVMVNTYSNRMTTSFIPILPNTAYFQTSPTSAYGGRIAFYDGNKNFLYFDNNGIPTTGLYTSVQGAQYMRVTLGSGYGTTYNHDIQLCLYSLPSEIRTVYHPHTESTLTLSSPVTLRSAGTVSEVLDVETGYKTRPIGVASNLGSYTWIRRSDGLLYTSTTVLADAYNATLNVHCAKYLPPDASHYGTSTQEGHISIASGGYIYVMDNTFSTADAFKTAMANVALYYELATPLSDEQVCDPIINNTLPTEGGGTIETIQTQTPVIDNSLDVGYLAI